MEKKVEQAVETEKPARVKAEKPKMYKVTIHSGEDKGDKGDVFLAHNAKSMLIQRDKEVVIPETFLECLKHSTIETTIKTDDGVERQIKIPRFSYNVEPA